MNVPAEFIRPLDDAETAGDGYDEDGFESEGSDTNSTTNATEQQEKDVLTQERAEGKVPRENAVSSGASERQNVRSVVEDAVAKHKQEEGNKPQMKEVDMLLDGFGNAGVPNMQVIPDWQLVVYPFQFAHALISTRKSDTSMFSCSNCILFVQRRSYYKLVIRVLQGRNLPPKLVSKHCACVVHCAVLKEAQFTGPSSNGQGSVTAEVYLHPPPPLSLSLSLCLVPLNPFHHVWLSGSLIHDESPAQLTHS